ncbi:MAG: DUF948 domain-containing protein [Cyanobacteria bacterium P01_F01_bin.153]
MGDPVFWLSISLLLVCVSLAVAIAIAIPALQELSRAARSAEKLFDTLTRELPPTLEAIRLTGLEISDLTDDMTSGVQQAGQVVEKVDRSFDGARQQVRRAGLLSRRTAAGMRAAWRSLTRSKKRRSPERLPAKGASYDDSRHGDGRYLNTSRNAQNTPQNTAQNYDQSYDYDAGSYDGEDYSDDYDKNYGEGYDGQYGEDYDMPYGSGDGNSADGEPGDRPGSSRPVPPSTALPKDTSQTDVP